LYNGLRRERIALLAFTYRKDGTLPSVNMAAGEIIQRGQDMARALLWAGLLILATSANLASAQKPSAPAKAQSAAIALDCRGTLQDGNLTSEHEAIVIIRPDDKRVTYHGPTFDGIYAITRMDEFDVLFEARGQSGNGRAGVVSRYTGSLILNTADLKTSAHLTCKHAKQMF
jgi:hypothetical protein